MSQQQQGAWQGGPDPQIFPSVPAGPARTPRATGAPREYPRVPRAPRVMRPLLPPAPTNGAGTERGQSPDPPPNAPRTEQGCCRVWGGSRFGLTVSFLVAGPLAARTARKCCAWVGAVGQAPGLGGCCQSSDLSTAKWGFWGSPSYTLNVSLLLKGLPGQVGLPGEIGALGPKVRGLQGAQGRSPP